MEQSKQGTPNLTYLYSSQCWMSSFSDKLYFFLTKVALQLWMDSACLTKQIAGYILYIILNQYLLMEAAPTNNPINNFSQQVRAFYQFHGVQFLGSKFPVSLIEQLYEKVKNRVYDAGQYFKIYDNEDSQTYEVHALKDIPAGSKVFLIDHAISFRYPQMRSELAKSPQLVTRLSNITKYAGKRKIIPAAPSSPSSQPFTADFDSMNLKDLKDLDIPQDARCFSLMQNKLTDEKQLIWVLQLMHNLKAFWIIDNPVQENAALKEYLQKRQGLQILNRKLTSRATTWGLKYLTFNDVNAAENTPDSEVYYLNLQDRGALVVDIEVYKKLPNLRRINLKSHQIKELTEINKLLALLQLPNIKALEVDYEVQLLLFQAFSKSKPQYLRKILVNGHSLFMPPPSPQQSKVDQIHSRIFKFVGCYRLASSQQLDQTSVWYVNDQFGSSFTHSDDPEVALAPFLYAPNNKMGQQVQTFTIMWTLKDLKQGQLAEKDYLCGMPQKKHRSSRLSVWYDIPQSAYLQAYNNYNQKLKEIHEKAIHNLQQLQKNPTPKLASVLQAKPVYKVGTDSQLILENLKSECFQITTNLQEADIAWFNHDITQHLDKVKNQNTLLNQFPYESCLVMKDNLAKTVQETLGETTFLQRTYDLQTQLPIFLGHYFSIQSKQGDNMWISKPPNMARSIDMLVSDNLDILIRNMETGPKLVQKYITYPVKRLHRKIDLRFILMVRSVQPLQAYLYKHFWIRTANDEYNLDVRFRQQYETHFTVMNYGHKMTQVMYPEFIQQFNKDYPIGWDTVYERIVKMLRLTLLAAQMSHPEMHSDKSRSMYGIDVMIDENTFEPKLLEFTYSPDCKRACKFYPTFFDQVFEALFLDKLGPNIVPLF